MRREKFIELGSGGPPVRVVELTVGQYRNLLRMSENLGFDPMRFLAGQEDIPPELLRAFTDLAPEKIEALTFSEMKLIIEGIKEVNSDFFDVLQSLAVAAGMLQAVGTSSPSSKRASGSS